MTTRHEKTLSQAIRERRATPSFDGLPIAAADLRKIIEAGLSAPSGYNLQPWRFVVAEKSDPAAFERILGTLVPQNQAWAKTAWALAISAGKKTFTHNGAPDRFGLHDAGAALANLMIQATAIGLYVHAMGGFDAAKARAEFGIPEDFEVGAAFAIGYLGEGQVPGERTRRALADQAFGVEWGKAYFS